MRKLEVRLVIESGVERVVGFLAESERRMYFEYAPEFLQDPLWLSPFKLPPEQGLHEHRDHSFGPVFGLFDDSLPDGWGLLLVGLGVGGRRVRSGHIERRIRQGVDPCPDRGVQGWGMKIVRHERRGQERLER